MLIHNNIPNQTWSKKDLFADGDLTRRYNEKWKLSQIALLKAEIVGVCIAFLDKDSTVGKSFLYIHRIAVLSKHRIRGVGSSLIKRVCEEFVMIGGSRDAPVRVQTPTGDVVDVGILPFYIKCGFSVIGTKEYPHRCDWILEGSVDRIVQSISDNKRP